MDETTRKSIAETVIEILNNSNLDETTEFQVRKSASEKLDMDLSGPTRKKVVRQVVDMYMKELEEKQEKQQQEVVEVEEEEEEEEEDDDEEDNKRGGKEYDDQGALIICRLSKTRRVTMSKFKGKTLVSIREYYNKGGKELPSKKGISLTTEQWASFKKNVPAIEKAIKENGI